MSGRISKSQIPVRHQSTLPHEALEALIKAKNDIRANVPLRSFGNTRGNTRMEGPPLPGVSQGCDYYEIQVGKAREEDQKGEGGSKRLVLELNSKSKQIMEVYYTDAHYTKFTFVRIV